MRHTEEFLSYPETQPDVAHGRRSAGRVTLRSRCSEPRGELLTRLEHRRGVVARRVEIVGGHQREDSGAKVIVLRLARKF